MFEYTINLNYCRLCRHERLPGCGNIIDLNNVISKKEIKPPSINRLSSVKINFSGYTKYQCGISIRYSVLRPKYGSLAEEMLLNDIHPITKKSFDGYLKEAIK
eukprot:1922_1